MASQDAASQLDSTPAFLEDVVPKNFDKIYVCRLLAFDETGQASMVRHFNANCVLSVSIVDFGHLHLLLWFYYLNGAHLAR